MRRLVLAMLVFVFAFPLSPARAAAWVDGDVFVGVAEGRYQVYSNNGTYKETISDGIGSYTTGCAFDATRDLYTTNIVNNTIVKYAGAEPHDILQRISTVPSSPESIVFAADGQFYVGHVGGGITRWDPSGSLQQTYRLPRVDWIDLAADQKTIYFTTEGSTIERYDLSTGTTDTFADLGSVYTFALRLLSSGDGSGGLIAAHSADVVRVDGSGTVVQRYDIPGHEAWFAMNLDPNGTSFWAADYMASDFARFNIQTGAVEVGPISTGTGVFTVFGLCVQGEPTAALARTIGEAYAARVKLAGIDTDKISRAFTNKPNDSSDQAVLAETVPGVVDLEVGRSTAETTRTPDRAEATSVSTIAHVRLLGGLIEATAVRAVARAIYGTSGVLTTDYDTQFGWIAVGGNYYSNSVAPNTTIVLPGVGTLILREEIRKTTAQGATLRINMIHFLSSDGSTEIIVGSAFASAGREVDEP